MSLILLPLFRRGLSFNLGHPDLMKWLVYTWCYLQVPVLSLPFWSPDKLTAGLSPFLTTVMSPRPPRNADLVNT